MKPVPEELGGRLRRIFVIIHVTDVFVFRMGPETTAASMMKKVQKLHVVLNVTFSTEDVGIVVS